MSDLMHQLHEDCDPAGKEAADRADHSLALAHYTAEAAQCWRPIASAPRDGTRVLTYRLEFRESMAVAWFNYTGCGDSCWVPVHGTSWPDPTHWMPLPEAP